MNRKPATLFNVILNAAAAIIWTINCVVLAVYSRQNESLRILLVLDIVCAVIWWVAFAVALVRYRKGRQDQ